MIRYREVLIAFCIISTSQYLYKQLFLDTGHGPMSTIRLNSLRILLVFFSPYAALPWVTEHYWATQDKTP
ncbi:MAG: hypothetical protein CSA32_03575 [Desulfobulbus propionicus]|nr:MAG: hypothetical protein CSA32_03575 [Desulfobulbus propionicus]